MKNVLLFDISKAMRSPSWVILYLLVGISAVSFGFSLVFRDPAFLVTVGPPILLFDAWLAFALFAMVFLGALFGGPKMWPRFADWFRFSAVVLWVFGGVASFVYVSAMHG